MVPILTYTLLAVEVTGAGLLWWRKCHQDYPAFLSYLVWAFLWGFVCQFSGQWALVFGLIPSMLLKVWILCEVYERSRSVWGAKETRVMSCIVSGSVIAAAGFSWRFLGLSPLQSLMNWNQHVHLALMASVWALVIRAHWWPMLERRRNRAYRWGAAGIFSTLGISGMMVSGGWAAPGVAVWNTARLVVLSCLILTIVGMTAGMLVSEHSKRTARIAGCSKRSNVVEFHRAA